MYFCITRLRDTARTCKTLRHLSGIASIYQMLHTVLQSCCSSYSPVQCITEQSPHVNPASLWCLVVRDCYFIPYHIRLFVLYGISEKVRTHFLEAICIRKQCGNSALCHKYNWKLIGGAAAYLPVSILPANGHERVNSLAVRIKRKVLLFL